MNQQHFSLNRFSTVNSPSATMDMSSIRKSTTESMIWLLENPNKKKEAKLIGNTSNFRFIYLSRKILELLLREKTKCSIKQKYLLKFKLHLPSD